MSERSRRRYGPALIAAAAVGAPVAAVLVATAAPALLPASSDLRYLLTLLLVVPLAATAPCLALLSRSAARAWGAVLVTCVGAAAVLWSSVR